MHTSKVKQNTSPDDLEETEASAVESRKLTSNQRRLADSLNPKGRKLKLNRRAAGRDQRTSESTGYKGPARRKTLDRRENLNDRRDEDCDE